MRHHFPDTHMRAGTDVASVVTAVPNRAMSSCRRPLTVSLLAATPESTDLAEVWRRVDLARIGVAHVSGRLR